MKKPSRALRLPSGRTTGSNLGGVTETTPQETTGKKKARRKEVVVAMCVCVCARVRGRLKEEERATQSRIHIAIDLFAKEVRQLVRVHSRSGETNTTIPVLVNEAHLVGQSLQVVGREVDVIFDNNETGGSSRSTRGSNAGEEEEVIEQVGHHTRIHYRSHNWAVIRFAAVASIGCQAIVEALVVQIAFVIHTSCNTLLNHKNS